MKRPFALLGGAVFAFLALAACIETAAVKALIFACMGLGFCALFGLAALWLWGKKYDKRSEKLPGERPPGAFSVLYASALIFLAGALSLSLYARSWETAASPMEKLDGVKARIYGTVLDYPQEKQDRIYYQVRVEKVSVNRESLKMPEFTARISTWRPISCQPYDGVECTVSFYAFDSSGGLYSSRNSWLADGVVLGAYLSDYETAAAVPDPGSPPGEWAARWRRSLGRSIEKQLPSEEAGLIRAVLLGEKERVSDRSYGNFKKIGASHLLVISGLHMTALASCLSMLFTVLRLNRTGRNLLTAGMLAGFLFLIGFPVSAVRSAIMYIIALLAGCLGRKADSVNSLGFAVFIICLANPFSGGDLGFALSVFSTLGILLLGSRIFHGLLRPFEKKEKLRRLLAPAAGSLSMTFSAMLFTLPLQIAVFGGVSLLAPLASLILVFPCTLLLYLSLAAAVLGVLPGCFALSRPFAFCAGWLARFSLNAAARLAQIPGTYLNLSQPVGLIVLAGVLLILSMLWAFRWSRPAVCAALMGILLLSGCGRALENRGRDTVTFIAVPDSSCVVVMKNRRAAVLSLGGYRTNAAEDLLLRNNIGKVEILCMPVRDRDAGEAAVSLLETFGADRLALPSGIRLGRELLLAGRNSARVYLEDGNDLEVLDGVRITSEHQMQRLTVEAYGNSVIVETGKTGTGSCGFLFTTQIGSRINSPFTVLQNDGIIEKQEKDALNRLPSGRYLFPGGDGLYLDLFRDGSISFRGETICLK